MNEKIGFSRKLGYGVGDLGCNLIFSTAGSFLTLYYTDSVLLSAAFVGTLMLVARLMDGVSDILMGQIIDHTNTRFGKARPYVLFGSIILAISFILLFNVPQSFSQSGKQVYAVITYIFMAVFTYTAVNLAYATLLTLMSKSGRERASLSSFRMFFSFLAIMLINALTPTAIAKLGGGQQGFSRMALIYGVAAFIFILLSGIAGKEYQMPSEADADGGRHKVPVKEAVAGLFSTKYTLLCGGAFIANWLLLSLNGASMVYYARDVLGNIGMMGALSIFGTLPTLILLGIVPKTAHKFGKQKMLVIGAFINVIGFLLPVLQPLNIPVVLAGCALKGIGLAFVNALLFASISDLCDYIFLKRNIHIEGLTNSIISFGMKLGTGFGGAFLGWLLAWGGYSQKLANSMQPQSALTMKVEIICYAGIPLVCAVIVLICVAFLDLHKKLQE